MQIFNNTPQQLFYGIGNGSSADCGTIDPGQTAQWPFYDNSTNVVVSFPTISGTGGGGVPLVINIPSTGTGKVVTVGLFSL